MATSAGNAQVGDVEVSERIHTANWIRVRGRNVHCKLFRCCMSLDVLLPDGPCTRLRITAAEDEKVDL